MVLIFRFEYWCFTSRLADTKQMEKALNGRTLRSPGLLRNEKALWFR